MSQLKLFFYRMFTTTNSSSVSLPVLESSRESESESRSVMSDSLQPCGLSSPWNSPVQNIGVGSLSLLQGIFPTQGSNPGLPHCRQILYQLSQITLKHTFKFHILKLLKLKRQRQMLTKMCCN